MKRAEYEARLASHKVETSAVARLMQMADNLDTQLLDLDVVINLYEDEGRHCFRILDQPTHKTLIEGLSPAYSNAGDYRQIVYALRAR
jgi:hypothetical protein